MVSISNRQLGLLIVLAMAVSIPKTAWPETVDSMKQVNIICLGYVDGKVSHTLRFKTALEKSLTAKGFKVVDKSGTCDEALVGSLESIEGWELMGRYITAKANMKLINPGYKVLWQGYFEPHYTWTPGIFLKDGILNRARDIAGSLAHAKKKGLAIWKIRTIG